MGNVCGGTDIAKGVNNNGMGEAPSSGPSLSKQESVESPFTQVELEAIKKIQRSIRNRSAWKFAQAEREWKIFSDLDTRDEADMLELATFMQTLLDWVPDSERSKPIKEIAAEMDETQDKTLKSSSSGGVDLENIQISGVGDNVHGDINDFILPKGAFDEDMASRIVNVYRKNGRLNVKSVQKVLRATYKMFKELGNITEVSIGRGEKLTVVGDLHGQLGDLLHILDESGWPSPTNKYIFNGDFVDRGVQGVEVMCVLLSLYAAFPNYVYLNRGNHEDHAICCVYGFQKECKEKYDDLTFGMFVEVFRHLPLFAVVNNSVFVVHGGLFHTRDVTLADLREIDRTDYMAKPPVPYPICTQGMDPRDARKEYLKQLQRDSLWSDPSKNPEVLTKNQRGSGVVFGSEVAKTFLRKNGLSMIVRSHECVRKGFDRPYEGPDHNLLVTIFSASNYCGGGNEAAYLVFATHQMNESYIPVVDGHGNRVMFYKPQHFQKQDAAASLRQQNIVSLRELILRRKKALIQAFEAADAENSGTVPKIVWSEVMQRVMQLKILWLPIASAIAPDSMSGAVINYNSFLSSIESQAAVDAGGANSMMDSMYGQKEKLEAVFRFFDKDGNGSISREEFKLGCDFMNTTLAPDQQLTDYDRILDMMDFDKSDSIDMNEFFEVFRILDAKDGKIDGVLSLAAQKSDRKIVG